MRKKVCVIGAGLSGLVALKELKAEGHHVVCYEKSHEIGGVFSNSGTAYDSLRLTASNYFMAYSDSMPEEPLRFWTGSEYKDYLERYTRQFGLRDSISFDTEIVGLSRDSEQWLVKVQDGAGTRVERFEHVVICSGLSQTPKIPEIEGLASYTGRVLHSSEYYKLDKGEFEGKTVLCVGMGESSADITSEISKLADRTILSLRRYHVLAPRFLPMHRDTFCESTSRPTAQTIDSVQTRAYHSIPVLFKQRIVERVWAQAVEENRGDPQIKSFVDHVMKAGFEPESVVTKSELIFGAIASGDLQQDTSGIQAFTSDSVIFNSGGRERIDVIMFCTGYQASAPFLDFQVGDVMDMYKHMIRPEYGDSLAFIGFVRPQQGGIPLIAELQSRYFALLCSRKRHLPSKNAMVATARADKEKCKLEFACTPHVSGLVNGLRFNEDLAGLIGCRPKRYPYLLSTKSATRYWHGHVWPIQYREYGPGALSKSEIAAYYQRWEKELQIWPWGERVELLFMYEIGSFFHQLRKWNPAVNPRLCIRPIS